MQTESQELVGGLLDIFRMWRSGSIADVLNLVEAIRAKDAAKIRENVREIASEFGFGMEAKELDDVVAGILAQNWGQVMYEGGDALMKAAVKYMGYVPPGGGSSIRVMTEAPPHIDTFTGGQARQWLADRRANVREAGRNFLVKARLRNAPELTKLMRGEGTQADLLAIDPERLAVIIDICRAAIPLLTIVGAFFPPCLIAATVLKFIVAYYDSNHPQTASATDNPNDKGLALGDLL